MSYQVLARKWRPRTFGEMVGQEHVLKALINALDRGRLHHAYLFTGTRGVGKTTVARILAKCLNCETGIVSSPCGVCSTCVEINEGRFVDLIEVDAASRTKVEDTRELLDNVQYSPTSGRFKIYLIDEVHMLSNSSFNALLKTLEEPPEHVKFLLATTDPQKLPATILSRCLQFNLKNMSPEKIVAYLQDILAEETVPNEESALWQLARAADGSMRDALSLTDQAIAFGNGKLTEAEVTSMLGTIDHGFVQKLVEALAAADGAQVLQAVAQFAEHAPDYAAALAEMQTFLHRVAIAQALPEALDNSYGDRKAILALAGKIAPEDVQLFYQTALLGQRDLHLCPVPRTGFEMTLLRMLAFKPQGVADIPSETLAAAEPLAVSAIDAAADQQTEIPAVDADLDPSGEPEPKKAPVDIAPRLDPRPSLAPDKIPDALSSNTLVEEGFVEPQRAASDVLPLKDLKRAPKKLTLDEFKPEQWILLYEQLELSGVLRMTVANLVCTRCEMNTFYFEQDDAAGGLLDKEHTEALAQVLSAYFASNLRVDITSTVGANDAETPAQYKLRKTEERRQQALKDLRDDPVVQLLEKDFGGTLDVTSLTIHE